jgi:hypothetical protein
MNPIFSPDGKRMAYIVSPGERAFVVVDGEEQRAYQDIHGNSLCFSPDSGRLAYLARGEHKQILVVDGVEQPFGEDIIVASSLLFRPRSEHPTYIASVFHGGFGKSVAVVDGVRGKEYGDIYEDKLWLSRDGSHVAYLARKDHGLFQGSSSVLVLDGCECMEFRRNDMPRSLWFSPDGKRLAFAPLRPARWFHRQKYYVAVNELEGNEYEGFAPDFGYFVFDGSSALHFMAYRNSEFVRAQVTIAGNSGG